MLLPTQTYSIHLFLFPFRWDIFSKETDIKNSSYDERTRLFSSNDKNISFDKLLLSEQSSWKHKPFSTQNNHLDYNQYHYFYEFVRSALFDNSLIRNTENPVLRTYCFEEERNLRFEIEINIGSEDVEELVTYNLKIDSIQLNAYDVGVGILSFHLSTDSITFERKKNFSSKDVLLINDFGRRLYPQFLGEGYNIKKTQDNFLAKNIAILSNNKKLINEDFTNNYEQNPDFLPAHILEILGKSRFTNVFDEDVEATCSQIKIQPLIDDRMFEVVQKNGTLFCIKNAKNGSKENQENARTLRA